MKTFLLPVKPIVKKYLMVKYGQVFRLSRKNNEGKFLIAALRAPQMDARFDKTLPEYSESLNVEASDDKIFERKCRNLSSRTVYDFNDFVLNLIKEEFIAQYQVLKGVGHQWTMNQHIDAFFFKYGFDEHDMEHDALKKMIHRKKTAKISKIAA